MKSNQVLSLGLVFALIFLLSAASVAQAMSVTATVPVGKAPSGLAYDSAKGEIFVTNGQDNTVSVINDTSNAVIATINVGTYPYGAVYDPAKGEIFVVNLNSNNVSVISDSTNKVVATINVGQSPYNCAYDAGKGEIFVANSYNGTVSVISDSSNTVIATVSVGAEPFGVAYDSGKGEVFVANQASVGGNNISVISDSTNKVVATIPMPGCQFLTYDSGMGEIFAGTSTLNDHTVSVISDNTNSVVATIIISSDVGTVPISGIVYDSGRNLIFVALHQGNLVKVISDSDNKVAQDIIVNNGPWAVAYDPGKGAIYVTNGFSNEVTVISDAGGVTPSSNAPTSGGIWIILIIIIIIILILLWYLRGRKLTITVKDSRRQAPITGAGVSAQGPDNLSGNTDNRGSIVFKSPSKGDYQIRAVAIGYQPSAPMTITVKRKTDLTVVLEPIAPTQGSVSGQPSSGGPN